MYTITRVALPLVAQACAAVELSCVFCEDDRYAPVTDREYDTHAVLLDKHVRFLASAKGPEVYELFWKETASALITHTQRLRPAGEGQPRTGSSRLAPAAAQQPPPRTLAQADPAALGWLFRLKPEMPPGSDARPESRHIRRPPMERVLSRRKEGGVSGIRLTRREDDLDSMLISEMLNPPVLLADRLLNTGFLATQREPKHQPQRDVLLVGMLPGLFHSAVTADMVKACWFEFLVRFGFRLLQRGRLRSEFVWIEGDALDRIRSQSFSLRHMPEHGSKLGGEPGEGYRRVFRERLTWLPDFADERARYTAPKARALTGPSDDLLERIPEWAQSAWQSAAAGIVAASGAARLELREYALVHVMVFWPRLGTDLTPDWASPLGRLHAALRFDETRRRLVSLTWVPSRVGPTAGPAEDAPPGWAFVMRQRPTSAWPINTPEPKLAGHLISAWLAELDGELGYA
jgi:hypothetical protein